MASFKSGDVTVNTPTTGTRTRGRPADQGRFGPQVEYRNGQYYTDGQYFATADDLIKYQQERTRVGQFNKDLARYDAEAQKYRQALLGSFNQQTQLSTGLAQRGTQAVVNQFLQRRGIDATRGGLGASLQNTAQTQLQGQAAQANMDFSTRLYSLMQQQRDAFVNKEFDFFKRIDLMGYEAQLQKDIMRFQAQLQSDLSFRDAFLGVMNLGGQVLGSFLPWAGAATSASQFTGAGYSGGSNSFESMYGY